MQLILDTDTCIDIEEKMTTLEETSEKNLNDNIEILKTAISNGNKENIQCQENIIKTPEPVINGNDKNDNNEEPDTSTPMEDTNLEYLPRKNENKEIDIEETNKTETQDGDTISNEKELKGQDDIRDTHLNECGDMAINEIHDEGVSIVENGIDRTEELKNTDVDIKDENNLSSVKKDIELEESKINDLIAFIDNEVEKDEANESKDIAEDCVTNNDIMEKEVVVEEVCNKDEGKFVNITETSVAVTESKAEDTNHLDKKNVTETSVAVSPLEGLEDSIDDSASVSTPETELVDQCNETNDAKSTETYNSVSIEISEAKLTVPTVEKVDDTVIEGIKVPEIDKSDAALDTEDNMKPSDNIESEKPFEDVMECDNVAESNAQNISSDVERILDVEEIKDINIVKDANDQPKEVVTKPKEEVTKPKEEVIEPNDKVIKPKEKANQQQKSICKLSNTLDILSDDEEESPSKETTENVTSNSTEKQCINIEDDDILFIDEDTSNKDGANKLTQDTGSKAKEEEKRIESTFDLENNVENVEISKPPEILPEADIPLPEKEITISDVEMKEVEMQKAENVEKPFTAKPLLPENFLKTYRKNLTDMTREDLEEFCVLKIVESIVDRSSLCDIKSKLKSMAQNIEEYKKKAMMLTKQNRDLQVVLKSVQEEQRKNSTGQITPLKITRSVGMQVLMTEKPGLKKKGSAGAPNTNANTNNTNTNNRNMRTPNQNPRTPQKPPTTSQQIPVPRLVPANNPAAKMPSTVGQSGPVTTQATKTTTSPVPNGVKNPPQAQKLPEKRPHSRVQSVTVDLTDDEPPAKITPRSSPAPPVRLVSPQNLLAPRPAFAQTLNSPRKVYIPISGPQNQSIRPGQAIMLKAVPPAGPRQRMPSHHQVPRMPQNTVRMARVQNRHPAPLPDAVKQYQPPNWKTLPPAPDLKLSKVENGIVISWKIEGYQEDSYEEIASYQLYAYQETSSPPSTALWKKIGDVKALPLPMACTLTQFMAGFKYYFAVRAVDIRSRLGPFSLPGSILLLNKM